MHYMAVGGYDTKKSTGFPMPTLLTIICFLFAPSVSTEGHKFLFYNPHNDESTTHDLKVMGL